MHVQDMREGNQRVYEKKGMDPAEIQSKLNMQEKKARNDYKRLLAMNGLL